MQITISGKKIKVGDSLQEYVEPKLRDSVKKFFDRAVDSNVTFSKDGKFFHAEIVVHEGTGRGLKIKASSTSSEVYEAFDLSLNKISKQLRRYKSKIGDHQKRKLSELEAEERFFNATKYVLPQDFALNDSEEPKVTENPSIIIAEKQTKIQSLTVSEAVMTMDLASLPALMFINRKNNRINMVYHREDGHIAWVDGGERDD